jgi:hypothetical protein
MTTRAFLVFEINDDYLDDLNSYHRPRSREAWREKVGYCGVMDQDGITEADGFSCRSDAMDYVDHLQSEEASQ